MQPDVIEKLLVLNQNFYDLFADAFSQTRQPINPGFDGLLEWLPQPRVRLLDVACGNGRFGQFLLQKDAVEQYVGVDFSSELLQIAAELTGGTVIQRNLNEPGALADLGQFDVVACLAALHHIPGQASRIRLLREMRERLAANGRLFLSTWQFMDSKRQQRKARPWSEIGLDAADVEPNDYLLTWDRGGFSYRYACMIDEAETAVLAGAASLQIVAQFRSDGREGNLSLYTVLRRS